MTINRTKLELKLSKVYNSIYSFATINRTKLELKQDTALPYVNGAILLIEPNWN